MSFPNRKQSIEQRKQRVEQANKKQQRQDRVRARAGKANEEGDNSNTNLFNTGGGFTVNITNTSGSRENERGRKRLSMGGGHSGVSGVSGVGGGSGGKGLLPPKLRWKQGKRTSSDVSGLGNANVTTPPTTTATTTTTTTATIPFPPEDGVSDENGGDGDFASGFFGGATNPFTTGMGIITGQTSTFSDVGNQSRRSAFVPLISTTTTTSTVSRPSTSSTVGSASRRSALDLLSEVATNSIGNTSLPSSSSSLNTSTFINDFDHIISSKDELKDCVNEDTGIEIYKKSPGNGSRAVIASSDIYSRFFFNKSIGLGGFKGLTKTNHATKQIIKNINENVEQTKQPRKVINSLKIDCEETTLDWDLNKDLTGNKNNIREIEKEMKKKNINIKLFKLHDKIYIKNKPVKTPINHGDDETVMYIPFRTPDELKCNNSYCNVYKYYTKAEKEGDVKCILYDIQTRKRKDTMSLYAMLKIAAKVILKKNPYKEVDVMVIGNSHCFVSASLVENKLECLMLGYIVERLKYLISGGRDKKTNYDDDNYKKYFGDEEQMVYIYYPVEKSDISNETPMNVFDEIKNPCGSNPTTSKPRVSRNTRERTPSPLPF